MEDSKPRILIFSSGGEYPDEGGSEFETLVWNTRLNPPILDAEIVGVVSNYEFGGVRTKADKLGISFKYFKDVLSLKSYQKMIKKFNPDFVILSEWFLPVYVLDPQKTINIHPGPLPTFRNHELFSRHVHEDVLSAYKMGTLTQSAVTIHFVTMDCCNGPIIVQYPVHIDTYDRPGILAKRVSDIAKVIQAHYINLVVNGQIWLGEKGKVHYNLPTTMPQFISQIS